MVRNGSYHCIIDFPTLSVYTSGPFGSLLCGSHVESPVRLRTGGVARLTTLLLELDR